VTTVSVVVAVRDGAPYLRDALDSVLDQSVPPLELIVVDDGSTDDTPAILSSYGDRIRAIGQPHGGQASATAAGCAIASGEMIAFNDADDLWTPDKQARQLAALVADSTLDAVFGMCEQFVSPELGPDDQARLTPPNTILIGEIAQSMLVRRSSFDRFGGIDPSTRGAWFVDWLSRAKAGGLRSLVLPDIVHRRRLHLNNYGRLHAAERNLHHLRALRGSVLRSRSR
jgi:glycosyltransferase involved in cell wall biosynthesis